MRKILFATITISFLLFTAMAGASNTTVKNQQVRSDLNSAENTNTAPQSETIDPSVLSSKVQPAENGVNMPAQNTEEYYRAKVEYYSSLRQIPLKEQQSTTVVPIVGDSCSNPIIIGSLPYTDTEDNCNFTDLYDYVGGKDVVYQITLASETNLTIETCESDPFDTRLTVYPASDCGGTYIAFDDDACAAPGYGGSKIITTLAAGTYSIIVDHYDDLEPCGNFTLNVYVTPECMVTCPPGAITEGEPVCDSNYVDSTNAGCNEDFYSVSYINFGDTICGTSGYYPDTSAESGWARDTDWYEVTLPGFRTIHYQGTADFPFYLFVIQASADTCGSASVLSPTGSGAPCDTVTLDMDLGPGMYWMYLRPADIPSVPDTAAWVADNAPCGSNYVIWLSHDPIPAKDAAPYSVDSPSFYRMVAGESTPISVTVTNLGTDGTYDFDCTVDIVGEVSGSVYSQTQTATDVGEAELRQLNFANFTPTCIENYTITATVSGVGEENPANDTLVSPARAIAFGLDRYDDGTATWLLGTPSLGEVSRFRVPAGHTADLNAGYIYAYGLVTGVSGPGNITPVLLDSNGPDGSPGDTLWMGSPIYVDDFVLEPVDLTTSGVSPTNDFYFGFFTEGPAGLGDPSLEYTGIHYSYYSANLTWYLVENFWNDPTDNMLVMDYDLTGATFIDVGPTSIDSPLPTEIGAGPFSVDGTVSNVGLAAATGVSATVTITGTGGTEFTSTVTGIDLVAGADSTVHFGDWAPSTGFESYDIEFSTSYGSDENICNDDMTGASFVLLGTPGPVEDFESDNGGYTTDDPTLWQWGADGTVGAHSGTNVWGTVLNANYPDSACGSLTTTSFAVPVDTGGALILYSWYDIEATWDYCNVKVSSDGGTSWTLVSPISGYDSQDTHPGNLCALVSGQYGFSGTRDSWRVQAFDLVDYAGETVMARIDFASDGNTNGLGMYVDDVFFLTYPEPAGCSYTAGDINGSDSYNGLDITYGVAFFKGGPDPMCPAGTCPLPPCDSFFYCGDVNGSCSYNGLDITYGVAFFKGGPGPVPCPSCPPTP